MRTGTRIDEDAMIFIAVTQVEQSLPTIHLPISTTIDRSIVPSTTVIIAANPDIHCQRKARFSRDIPQRIVYLKVCLTVKHRTVLHRVPIDSPILRIVKCYLLLTYIRNNIIIDSLGYTIVEERLVINDRLNGIDHFGGGPSGRDRCRIGSQHTRCIRLAVIQNGRNGQTGCLPCYRITA